MKDATDFSLASFDITKILFLKDNLWYLRTNNPPWHTVALLAAAEL